MFYSLKQQTINFNYSYEAYLYPSLVFELYEDGNLIIKKTESYSWTLNFTFDVQPNKFYEFRMYCTTNKDVANLITLKFIGDITSTPSDGGRAYWSD